jgi:hypothetical protein
VAAKRRGLKPVSGAKVARSSPGSGPENRLRLGAAMTGIDQTSQKQRNSLFFF